MKKIKLALFALGLLATGLTNAQNTTTDIAKKGNANLGTVNKTVRVIDNKGTIKYLQVDNGLTSFTNRTPSGGVVTTWQLGGTLGTNTFIEAGTNKEFALDGIALATSTAVAATQAINRSSHDSATTNTGFTVLIRDEETGAIQKMMLTDLLKVQSAVHNIEIDASSTGPITGTNTTLGTSTITSSTGGFQLDFITDVSKVQVYRNGAKLRAYFDYVVRLDGTDQFVYLKPDTTNPDTNPQYWDLYVGDIIEIHAFK